MCDGNGIVQQPKRQSQQQQQQHDRESIESFYDFINHSPYGVTEVRVIKPGTQSSRSRLLKIGYFDNKKDFVEACMGESGKEGSIYVSENPCPRRFLARSPNRLTENLPEAVKDDDVEYVTCITLDIDPERLEKSYTASTDAELERASMRAMEIADHLVAEGMCRREEVLIAMTGNGYHIHVPIPAIEVNNGNREEIKSRKRAFERQIRERFSDDSVKIDSVHHLSPVTKAIGTMSMKGQDTSDRPRRVSRPITDMERHESSALRDYILNLEVEERALSNRSGEPATPVSQDELPTDLDMDNPCDMCPAARRLWEAEHVDDRSKAVFAMMKVLVAKGLSRAEAIAYMQRYDSRIGGKYTSRTDDGLRELSNMYDKAINESRRHMVPCKWLQDNGYCDIDTSSCDDPNRSGSRYREAQVSADEVKTVSLDEARQELERDVGGNITMETGPRTHLIVYPSGVGKTHQVAEHVRLQGWKVLWLCATHRQANETIDRHFQELNVAHLKSRVRMIEDGELECPYESDIRSASEYEQDASQICSSRCYRYRKCEYYQNSDSAEDADIIVGMHDHMQFPDYLRQYMEDVDCVVINEEFSEHYRDKQSFTRTDVELSIAVLEGMAGDESMEQGMRDRAREWMEYCQEFLSEDECSHSLHDLPAVDDEFMKEYRKRFHRMKTGRISRDVLDDLGVIADGEVPSDRIQYVLSALVRVYHEGETIMKEGDRYTYVNTAQLPTNKHVVILDASGTKEFYEAFLCREVTVYGDTCYVDQVAHVTQFLDGAYPRTSLVRDSGERTCTYHRVKGLIEAIKEKHPDARIVVGAVMKVEEKLREDGVGDDRTDLVHYRDQRGIDEYRDYDVLIVVGIPMLSFEDIAKGARITFRQDWNDEEMVSQMQKDCKRYQKARYSKGGMGYEIETYHFSNRHIQRYYQKVLAEIIQMIGRIRPYEGRTKHVYIVGNTPLPGLKIDQMVTVNDFMEVERERRREMRDIRAAVEQMPSEFKVEDLAVALGRASNSQKHYLRKVLRENQEYLGIRMEPWKRTITKLAADQPEL